MIRDGETRTPKLVPRLVLILTIYAPDGTEHKHARLPNGTELDTVLDELIAKYGDGNGQLAVGRNVEKEYRNLPAPEYLNVSRATKEPKEWVA